MAAIAKLDAEASVMQQDLDRRGMSYEKAESDIKQSVSDLPQELNNSLRERLRIVGEFKRRVE